MLNRAVPRIVGTRLSRFLRRFQGLLRLFTSRMLTPLRVHALPLFSHAWLLLVSVTDPRPPPPAPAFSPFRDGHYWCSKCPDRGFTIIPGLMRHVTHPARGLLCGRGHLLLVRGDRTSDLHGSRLWWPQKNGRSGLQSMRAGQSGQWATSSWALLVLLPVGRMWSWLMSKPLPRPASP